MTVDIVATSTGSGESITPGVKITAMPGKHVPDGVLGAANDLLHAIPPTNGWMVELGRTVEMGEASDAGWQCGYR